MALSYRYVVARIPTGCNPRHLALSPDGRRLFVAERLDDGVLIVDTASLKPLGRIVLGDGGPDDPVRLGERVFTRARYTFQGQFSCRSCHPDGRWTGSPMISMEAVSATICWPTAAFAGWPGTEPFKWNGRTPPCSSRMGRGLPGC